MGPPAAPILEPVIMGGFLMPDPAQRAIDELGSTRPRFLDLLDADAEAAREQFCDIGYRYLAARPLHEFRTIPGRDPHDIIVEILMHLVKGNLRALRTYRDQGRPFACWLRRVARFKALDIAKKEQRERRVVTVDTETVDRLGETRAASPGLADPFLRDRLKRAMRGVRDTRCYCVLTARLVRNYTNKELARLYPEYTNAEIGGIYARCRQRLIDHLRGFGITEADLAG